MKLRGLTATAIVIATCIAAQNVHAQQKTGIRSGSVKQTVIVPQNFTGAIGRNSKAKTNIGNIIKLDAAGRTKQTTSTLGVVTFAGKGGSAENTVGQLKGVKAGGNVTQTTTTTTPLAIATGNKSTATNQMGVIGETKAGGSIKQTTSTPAPIAISSGAGSKATNKIGVIGKTKTGGSIESSLPAGDDVEHSPGHNPAQHLART